MAAAMGAVIASRGADGFPASGEIDSRRIQGGELFFGLRGGKEDGGRFAAAALESGAWGAVVEPDSVDSAVRTGGWVFAAEDPLAAMQSLATAWRRELGSTVIGITGSVGKTSVKDITRAILPGRVHASEENFNTEIGLPLTILAAPEGTETLVLEMAMRGAGQIAELAAIAEPDIGVITIVGPVHLELLGTIEAIAAAKAEIIEGLAPGSPAIVPVDAGYLEPHLEGIPGVVRFGTGGDVYAEDVQYGPDGTVASVVTPRGTARFAFPFTEAHNLTNALTAVAAGVAAGHSPVELASRAGEVAFSRLRGEHLILEGGTLVVNDCYNANPVSMRAALDYLGGLERSPKIAVLGLMGELGPEADRFHREVGEYAREAGADVIVGVGPLASHYAPDHLVADQAAAVELLDQILAGGAGDSAGSVAGDSAAVLIKGSRAAGLEAVTEGLLAERAHGEGVT
jgi:UDP-N-acetylmuramoyl-tripeptide--D-alanyl-D-alanine ligase